MNEDLSDYLENDKDNKFHGTSVAELMQECSGMTPSLYWEVQKIWEELQRTRAFHEVTKVRYRVLCGELKALLEENT